MGGESKAEMYANQAAEYEKYGIVDHRVMRGRLPPAENQGYRASRIVYYPLRLTPATEGIFPLL